MSFAQPRNVREVIVYRIMPISILLAIAWTATSGIPHAPGTVWDPHPGVPPTPYPLPGEDGYKIPGEDKPPVDEGPKEPTYH